MAGSSPRARRPRKRHANGPPPLRVVGERDTLAPGISGPAAKKIPGDIPAVEARGVMGPVGMIAQVVDALGWCHGCGNHWTVCRCVWPYPAVMDWQPYTPKPIPPIQGRWGVPTILELMGRMLAMGPLPEMDLRPGEIRWLGADPTNGVTVPVEELPLRRIWNIFRRAFVPVFLTGRMYL